MQVSDSQRPKSRHTYHDTHDTTTHPCKKHLYIPSYSQLFALPYLACKYPLSPNTHMGTTSTANMGTNMGTNKAWVQGIYTGAYLTSNLKRGKIHDGREGHRAAASIVPFLKQRKGYTQKSAKYNAALRTCPRD